MKKLELDLSLENLDLNPDSEKLDLDQNVDSKTQKN